MEGIHYKLEPFIRGDQVVKYLLIHHASTTLTHLCPLQYTSLRSLTDVVGSHMQTGYD